MLNLKALEHNNIELASYVSAIVGAEVAPDEDALDVLVIFKGLILVGELVLDGMLLISSSALLMVLSDMLLVTSGVPLGTLIISGVLVIAVLISVKVLVDALVAMVDRLGAEDIAN
jgi:hypothetical protein